MPSSGEVFASVGDACLDRGDDLERVVLVPAGDDNDISTEDWKTGSLSREICFHTQGAGTSA